MATLTMENERGEAIFIPVRLVQTPAASAHRPPTAVLERANGILLLKSLSSATALYDYDVIYRPASGREKAPLRETSKLASD